MLAYLPAMPVYAVELMQMGFVRKCRRDLEVERAQNRFQRVRGPDRLVGGKRFSALPRDVSLFLLFK